MVLEIDTENKDLLIKFMHPALLLHSFYCKEDFKDICFVYCWGSYNTKWQSLLFVQGG